MVKILPHYTQDAHCERSSAGEISLFNWSEYDLLTLVSNVPWFCIFGNVMDIHVRMSVLEYNWNFTPCSRYK